ncbi:hypothetical protein KR084_010668 [Drosophila pseudotakahashii]|nr:hypothetical protein KR084_010668 [Drosophila pseudotakahashii]
MMEERRLERQRRLLALRSAAPSLPSTHTDEFNLRLVDLYKAEPCLWNTRLPEHKDAELKRYAWEKIAAQLGSHLSAEFVRCRMRSMRYHLNVYNLQMIEYRMSPPSATEREPEKPFYHERFAFLETTNDTNDQKDSESGEPIDDPKPSTSDKLAKLWSDFNLKTLAKRESLAASSGGQPIKERRSGPSILGMVKMRLQEAEMKPLEFSMPRLGIPRIQRNLTKNRVLDQSFGSASASMEALSQSPPALQARPGDSVSKTKLDRKLHRDGEKPATSQKAQGSQSEDEELYSLHWNVRKEQRSLRPGHEQQRQKHPLKLRSSQANEPTPEIF